MPMLRYKLKMPQGRENSDESRPRAGMSRTLVLTTVGITLAVSVGLGAVVGMWLDRHWGTEPWLTVAGLLVGAAAGFLELWRTVQRVSDAD